MLLLLSTFATRCDFSALIVNRKMTTLVGAERESRSLGPRESRAFWAITDVGSGKPCGIRGRRTQRAVKRSDKMSR